MEKPQKDTKRFSWSTVLLVVALIAGLGVMAYPSVSDWWNKNMASSAVFGYEHQVSAMSKDDYKKLFREAKTYNDALGKLANPFTQAKQVRGYNDALRVGQTDVMGYVTIKKIDVELPIYHGTDESVLAVGAGHLEGTDLPIGGKGNHSAVSAHRGLPSASLFTGLDRLEKGDEFVITVLDRKMRYRVDDISIVLPDDTDKLLPVEGRDLCTLVTCTPYGVNTHRLLVRGTRVKGDEGPYVASEAFKLDPLVVAPVVGVPLLVLVVIGLIARSRREEEGEDDDEQTNE